MKILYVASDQHVPGRTGGSVHVDEVAAGLAARGHEVHVFAIEGSGERPASYRVHPSGIPFRHRFFRWATRGRVRACVDEAGIDVVIERYYNFGGEGVRAAHDRDIPALVEVNSPLTEYPGSLKSRIDGLLLMRPMARLRDDICRKATAFISPLPSIIPEQVPREKIHEVSWGANVESFTPEAVKRPLAIPTDKKVVAFSGSFRPWHGADVLVRAAAELPEAFFLFIGDGPEQASCRRLAEELGLKERMLFTGAVRYEEVPSYLRWADVGVAPYQPGRLGQMQLGFYWSPLKIFEYMAMGVPVVSLDVPPLREIVRASEGRLVPEGDPSALARAIDELLTNNASRDAMSRSARERVVAHYSWQRHCEQLDDILRGLTTS